MSTAPYTGIRHPEHGGGNYNDLHCDQRAMSTINIYQRKIVRQMPYLDKMIDFEMADKCENLFKIKSQNLQKIPTQDLLLNKNMSDKAVWIKPGVVDKKRLGRPRGVTLRMKDCDYQKGGHQDMMDALAQFTYDQAYIEQTRACKTAFAAVPRHNKGWAAGARDGCIQLGTKGMPLIWTPSHSDAIAAQAMYALRQAGFNPNDVAADAMYVKAPSALGMALKLPGAHNQADLNGNCRPDCNTLKGCGVPDMFGCFRICEWDEKPTCFYAADGGKKIPVYRLLFGVRKHMDQKSLHGIRRMESLVIPPQTRDNIFADYWEWQYSMDMDVCPAEPNLLVEMWVAIPKPDMAMSGLPAGG